MRTYLEVDLPQPLSTNLFLAFSQKPRQKTPEHPKEEAGSSEASAPDSNVQNVANAAKADEACAPDTESKTAETQVPAKDQVAAIPPEKLVAQSSGSESPIVYLKDVVCYLSLLETGRPQDKLECKYSPCQEASTFFLEEDLLSCPSFQSCWRLFWDHGYGS